MAAATRDGLRWAIKPVENIEKIISKQYGKGRKKVVVGQQSP